MFLFDVLFLLEFVFDVFVLLEFLLLSNPEILEILLFKSHGWEDGTIPSWEGIVFGWLENWLSITETAESIYFSDERSILFQKLRKVSYILYANRSVFVLYDAILPPKYVVPRKKKPNKKIIKIITRSMRRDLFFGGVMKYYWEEIRNKEAYILFFLTSTSQF